MNPQDARPVSPGWLAAHASDGCRVIDLRPPAEFEAAHIPGSSRMDPEEIAIPFLRPPRRCPVILAAEDPDLAARVARDLRETGFLARPLSTPVSRWDGVWESGPETRPPWDPSPLVALWAPRIHPGAVCDLACGSGRDAVYLAMRGFEVVAFDILPDALDLAARLAARHGVRVRMARADLETDSSVWSGPWAAIHVHNYLHRPALPLLPERLSEGGTLLYETFTEDQERAGRKPRNPAHLLKSGELLAAARGLEILTYCEGANADGDWTAALVARKGEHRASG